jgi:hypothetical protein
MTAALCRNLLLVWVHHSRICGCYITMWDNWTHFRTAAWSKSVARRSFQCTVHCDWLAPLSCVTARLIASSRTLRSPLPVENRNVGLLLGRSNATLSKRFTLSRVWIYFHPEGDPPSFAHMHGCAFFTLQTSRRAGGRWHTWGVKLCLDGVSNFLFFLEVLVSASYLHAQAAVRKTVSIKHLTQ